MLHNYEFTGYVLVVKEIPKLSSSGIKHFYLDFDYYPTDSLYIDIRQKSDSYCTNNCYNYIEMKYNGVFMEYSEQNLLYYIKK